MLYLRCTNRHLNSTLLPLVFQIILQYLKESDNENVPKDFSCWCRRISPGGADRGLSCPILPPASIASHWPASRRSDDLRPAPAAARYRGRDGGGRAADIGAEMVRRPTTGQEHATMEERPGLEQSTSGGEVHFQGTAKRHIVILRKCRNGLNSGRLKRWTSSWEYYGGC